MASKRRFRNLWFEDITDALHKGVSGGNRDMKRWVQAKIPVDDGEVRNGVRCLKKRGRPQKNEIRSSLYVEGDQTLKDGRAIGTRGGKIWANQLIANTLVKRGYIQLTEGEVHARWQRFWQEAIDTELGSIRPK